jgi:hypothetical protein
LLVEENARPLSPGCGNHGKLYAKNAAGFPRFPQPLLLVHFKKEKDKNKTHFLFERGLTFT